MGQISWGMGRSVYAGPIPLFFVAQQLCRCKPLRAGCCGGGGEGVLGARRFVEVNLSSSTKERIAALTPEHVQKILYTSN